MCDLLRALSLVTCAAVLLGHSAALPLHTSPAAEDPLAGVRPCKTEHYRVLLAGDAERVQDYARLVEAARRGFEQELGRRARFEPGRKITLRLYPDRDAWEQGMTHEQVFALPVADYVHYEPRNETVYAYGDPEQHFTRKMLLYGLFQQYHLRCKPKHQDLTQEWYLTGMADVLSTHTWNGEDLVLGARRLLSHEDRASTAVGREVLSKLAGNELSVETLWDWDLRWALTAFLMYGEDGAYRKGFEKLALGKRGSMLLGRDYLSNLGDPQIITAQLHAWLEAQAGALTPEMGSWRQVGGVLHAAVDPESAFAVALAPPDSKRIEAQHGDRGPSACGLVLDWFGPKDCMLALRHDDILRVLHVQGREVLEIGVFDMAGKRAGRTLLSAELEGEEVHLRLGDERLHTYDSHSRRLGLAVQTLEASFERVAWE